MEEITLALALDDGLSYMALQPSKQLIYFTLKELTSIAEIIKSVLKSTTPFNSPTYNVRDTWACLRRHSPLT